MDNGPGCGSNSLDKNECAPAVAEFGYRGAVLEGSWSHAPYGCFVGHPSDNWANSYFNSQHGQTGRNVYKSICNSGMYFISIILNICCKYSE